MTIECWFAAVHAPDWLALPAADWERVVECGIAGLDIRIAQPRNGPSGAEKRLAKACHDAGLRVRVHGWVGHRGVDGNSIAGHKSGLVDGRAMGTAGHVLGAEMVGMNAERDVWRGANGRANPGALDFYRGFHEGSLSVYPTGRLQDVGFADPREHYMTADLDGDGHPDNMIPRDVAELFDLKGVMAYQSNEDTLKRKLARGRAIAGPEMRLAWWSGIGRPSPKAGVVGSYDASLKGCRERWSGIDEWVGYVGFTEPGQSMRTIEMLTKGHARHRPLVDLVRAIRGKVV